MTIRASRLRKDIKNIINDQPIMVYRYILITGDGVTTGNSYQAAGSWRGRIDTLGRNVWFAMENRMGEAAQRMFNLILPYNAEGIDVNDKVELFNLDGSSAGVFIVVWVEKFADSSGVVWKVECNIEGYQG